MNEVAALQLMLKNYVLQVQYLVEDKRLGVFQFRLDFFVPNGAIS